MLTKRSIDLIYDISTEKYTLTELANKHHISDRMLRYDINEINEVFIKYFNDNIIEIKNSNVYLLIDPTTYNKYISQLPIEIYTLTSNEREYLIILDILLFNNKFKIQEICDTYLVSKSTTRQIIKNISYILSKYKLKLCVSSSINKGYTLVANELDIRKFLINHLQDKRQITENNPFMKKLIENKINKFSCATTIKQAKNEILNFLKEYDLNINDEAFMIVSYYLFLAKNRNYQGFHIKNESIDNRTFLYNTKEYNCVKQKINKVYFNENDILVITDFLIGLYNFNKNYSFFANWVLTEQLVFNILKKLSNEFNIDFTKDKILINELLHHIKPAIYRMKNNLKLSESIVDQVIKEYGETYFKVNKALEYLKDILNIELDADEISFITIMIQRSIKRNSKIKVSNYPKILIICGFGYSSSKLIAENLNENFYVNIVDTIPYNKLQNYKNISNIDLIITTIDITLNTHDILKVNTIFNEEDINKLSDYGLVKRNIKIPEKELLEFIENNRNLSKENLKIKIRENFKNYILEEIDENNYKNFYEFLNKNNTRFQLDINNLDELLNTINELMCSNGYTTPKYINSLKIQIKKYGSYIQIGKKTILPHGELNVDVLKTGFVLITLKNPINFFGEKISIIIALASKNVEEHRLAVLDINKYLKNNDFETKLEKIKNYIELIKFLKSLSVEGDSNENSRY